MQAPVELVGKKKKLLLVKPSQKVIWTTSVYFYLPFLMFPLEIFFDKQRKAVGHGTEASATQACLLG